MRSFDGIVAVVTGGGSGIGRAVALQLVQAGATVVVVGRRTEPLEQTCALAGDRCHAIACDVTDRDAVFAMVVEVEVNLGPIDLYMANAGVGIAGEVTDLEEQDWTRIRAVNYDAVVYGIEAVYPGMVARGRGHLVHVGSAAGLLPRPGMAPYAAAKHAVTGLTLSLRPEAAQHGIGVTLVCPGPVATDIVSRSATRGLDADRLTGFTAGKGVTPEQCARELLDGVRRNRAVVPITPLARLEWRLYRASTRAGLWVARLRLWGMKRVAGR